MSEKSRPSVGRRVPTPMPPPNDSLLSNQQRSVRRSSPAAPLHNMVFAQNLEHYIEVRNSTPKMDRNGLFFNTPSTAKKKKINLIESRQPQLAFYDEKRPGFARRIDFEPVDGGSMNSNAMRASHPQGDIMKAQYVPRAKLHTQLESYQPKYHAIRDADRKVIEDGRKVRKRIDSPRHVREDRISGLTASYRSSTKCASGSPHRRKRSSCAEEESPAAPGGYCAALQKGHPSAPPALLRRLGVKEPTGMGKVKVMLRVGASGEGPFSSPSQKFSLDKRKKQVSLYENTTSSTAAPEDRKVGVAAPKMFAFDAIFSQDDAQTEICTSALTDVIHAVVNGTDGCLLCFGHAGLGKSYTMLGRPDSPANLGAIPCAITWLFKGIAEQKHKCGTKFSVRVSAVELCTNTNQIRDLLAPYQNDSEQSPGVYLRDDPLFGTHLQNQSELRAHSAEKAAFYLDAALATRGPREEGKDSHLLFTIHVYQYNIAAGGKGAVAGGRSRLHLIDLGNTERGKSTGGIPFSGIGNILLAIFNGQRHLPYRDHSLTHVLKECLGSLTCHTAMIVHVSPTIQSYSDTLTTLQLASRIHRLRRRKIKFPSNNNPGSGGSSGEEAKPSSSEPDPSSSDLSADTVIYVGPIDDATDGEHPPVYIPHINSGDNRCVMSKALRGSVAERHKPSLSKVVEEKSPSHKLHSTSRSPLLKTTTHSSNNSPKSSPVHCSSSKSTPMKKAPKHFLDDSRNKSPFHKNVDGTSDEQWIDGPRISKSKLVEARHIIKETHENKLETWIDGPIKNNLHMETVSLQHNMASLQLGILNSQGNESLGYGYMDSHKKNMIRKWVENQTSQMHKSKHSSKSSHQSIKETSKQYDDSEPNQTHLIKEASKRHVEESTIRTGLKSGSKGPAIEEENIAGNCSQAKKLTLAEKSTSKAELDDDDDSEEMAEIPPALPLIKTLSSREVSMESLDNNYKERMRMDTDIVSNRSCNVEADGICKGLDEEEDEVLEIVEIEEHLELVPMQDCSLQVTEEDIALAMGLQYLEYQDDSEHPLKILSQENLTIASTFTDTLSLYSDLERQMKNESYLRRTLDFFTENFTCDSTLHDLGAPLSEHTSRSKIDELIGLVDLYARTGTNQMDPTVFMRMNPQFQSLSNVRDMDEYHGNGSVYSEPAYKPSDKICDSCKRTMSRPGSAADECNEYHHLDDKNPDNFGPFEMYRDHRDMTDARIASLRHPDGASDPNLREEKKQPEKVAPLSNFLELKSNLHLEVKPTVITTEPKSEKADKIGKTGVGRLVASSKPDGYDSGHESTPRTGKHSPAGTSRRAESGYDSVPRDSDASSLESYPTRRAAVARAHAKKHTTAKYKQHSDRSFCSWLKNPFTCKYADTDPEVSDF